MLARKSFETPRSDQFNIKKVGIQTNKPLNWQHGGYTCSDIICINRRFIPVATKEPFTKTLKCLPRLIMRPHNDYDIYIFLLIRYLCEDEYRVLNLSFITAMVLSLKFMLTRSSF